MSQDLFDADHARKFANYLFLTGQYEFAAEEFERVVFLAPDDSSARIKLLDAYISDGKFETGLNRLTDFYRIDAELPPSFTKQYLKLMFYMEHYSEADTFLKSYQGFGNTYKHCYTANFQMLDNNWDKAKSNLEIINQKDNSYFRNLESIVRLKEETKYKSPALAGIYSAIIPGSGKVYTKNWQDGLVAFLFVSVNAWQAYRGFDKYGTKSAYGWIFGSLAVTFYAGNIFGSVKSAKKYNNKLDEDIFNRSSAALLNNL
ncbi:MAG: hypothetical protein KDC05_03755 [Bacteroidales bacterium]|nr:hypothetical protein [Bacteroidales bacterium]